MYIQSRPSSAPRNKTVLPLTVCGCLCVALIAIAVIGVGTFRSGSTGVKQAGAEAGQFLTALEKRDNQAAFDVLSVQARDGKTVENVKDAMEILAKRHGHPLSHRQLPGFYINTVDRESSVRFNYQENFEKGEVSVQIAMVYEGSKWRVLGFNFQP